ncbi:unnamed protein product [Arctia plantaginis]|uniref:Uncharacterized protein n=1 Tax=Arctia plantaginis TaxID=874455 RepID=A0A8S1B829_ARCPL|nr:unnamed protein product [Arctia plantaginis]
MCVRKCTIPEESETQVLIKLPSDIRKAANRCVLIEDAPLKTVAQNCMTARTLVKRNSSAVRVVNLDHREIAFNKGDVIGQCEEVVWGRKCASTPYLKTLSTRSDSAVTELLKDCNNLTYSQSIKAK